jgi:hypothetical protein
MQPPLAVTLTPATHADIPRLVEIEAIFTHAKLSTVTTSRGIFRTMCMVNRGSTLAD